MKKTTSMRSIKTITQKQELIEDVNYFMQAARPVFTRLITVTSPPQYFGSGSHTHPASCAKVEVRITINSMRDAVHAGCATSTRELIADATQPQ